MFDLNDFVGKGHMAAFRQAWEDARSSKSVPRRRDIGLRGFSSFIPNMIVLERLGPRDYRYCQAGEGVNERLDVKATGVNFFDMLHKGVLDISEVWWANLLDTPCGGAISYSISYPTGALRHVATLLLPVTRDQGGCDLLVGLTSVVQERFIPEASGRTTIGEHLAEGLYLDIGFGLPQQDMSPHRHAPNPDFMSRGV